MCPHSKCAKKKDVLFARIMVFENNFENMRIS
jgi:hypothetical protein